MYTGHDFLVMIDSTPPPGPLIVDIAGTALSADDHALIAHPAVGGVILFTHNYTDKTQLASLTAAIKNIRPNLLIAADTEGGPVQQFCAGFTRVPSMRALGRMSIHEPVTAERAAREIAWLMAVELAEVGVHMPLAPVVDIDYGASFAMHERAFGNDMNTVSALASAFCAGLAAVGSPATAKHFPGHGGVEADSHEELPVDNRTHENLDNDLAPYRELIEMGALASVMMAHVLYPAVDDRPASLSARWITDILRGDLGFSGCVFCDDLSMGGVAVFGDHLQCAHLALTAGCDFLPVCNNRATVENLLEPVLASDTKHARCHRKHLCEACRAIMGASDRPNADKSRMQVARTLIESVVAHSENGG